MPVRTLVRELVAISGYDGSVTEGAPAAGDGAGRSRAGGTSWQQADIGRARRDLDWEPRRELTAALADLWEECRAPAAS